MRTGKSNWAQACNSLAEVLFAQFLSQEQKVLAAPLDCTPSGCCDFGMLFRTGTWGKGRAQLSVTACELPGKWGFQRRARGMLTSLGLSSCALLHVLKEEKLHCSGPALSKKQTFKKNKCKEQTSAMLCGCYELLLQQPGAAGLWKMKLKPVCMLVFLLINRSIVSASECFF